MPSISRVQNDPLINRSIKVGTFDVPITVANLSTGQSVTVKALVDTGATLTVLPASILREIGVEPTSTDVFELADGRRVEWLIGEVRVTVEGLTTPSLCIFGEEGVSPILGVVVLESVALTIDPAHLRLVKTTGLM
ncbi:MAG: hypothetical protein EXR50_04345 [Dehalococcoidia bacterium]|nr:hypothetical protein [Dehalococcoidia bacterium]